MTTDNHDSAALRRALEASRNIYQATMAHTANRAMTEAEDIALQAIARVEALEAELAEARAELDDFEPLDDVEVAIHAQQVLDELHRRGLHAHPNAAPVSAEAAIAALRTVLDGVAAVHARPIDLGVTTGDSPVEASVPVPDEDGWYEHDGKSWPACKPGDAVEALSMDGRATETTAGDLDWHWRIANCGSNIVRWRYDNVRGGGE